MCTVTYIPFKMGKEFVLTSNRDEKHFRPTAPPKVYKINGTSVCFPKDAVAGGSWIAMNEHGRVACLLNGAFKAHQKQEYHTNSRGTVLLNLAATTKDSLEYFDGLDLKNTEPFTIVTIDYSTDKIEDFTEFIWDGKDKHFRLLDSEKSHLWSSSTLYNEDIRKKRKNWFLKFLERESTYITANSIKKFHAGTHTGNKAINLVMERNDGIKTVSITQVFPSKKGLSMNYSDLLNNTIHEKSVKSVGIPTI